MGRLNRARAATMTCSPAWRPWRLLRRDRAVAAIWCCMASTSLAATASSGRSRQTMAIRCQYVPYVRRAPGPAALITCGTYSATVGTAGRWARCRSATVTPSRASTALAVAIRAGSTVMANLPRRAGGARR
jgi:hypothetical protein